MTNPIFDDLDLRLSTVKRWSILHTQQKQSVAEHVHNVTRITVRIGVNWFGLSSEQLLSAMIWAHHHDDLEAIMGDPPSMVKPFIAEDSLLRANEELFPILTDHPPQHIENIVKLADRLERYYFLAMEVALGNEYCRDHFTEEFKLINAWVKDRFERRIQLLVHDWMKSVENPRSYRTPRVGP